MADRDGPSEDVVRDELRHEREEVDGRPRRTASARRGTGGSSDDAVARAEAARSAEARMAAGSGGAPDGGGETSEKDENAGNGLAHRA